MPPNEKPWPWMGKEGPNEAGLVRLSESRLFCIFRTGSDGYLGEAWSLDDGKTWTPPVSTGFKGVAPHLRLLSNGLVGLCTYGRPGPVTIMFSSDEGKNWVGTTPIFSGKSTRYTDLIEVEPGKLLVVYDSVPYGGIPSRPPTNCLRMPSTAHLSRFEGDDVDLNWVDPRRTAFPTAELKCNPEMDLGTTTRRIPAPHSDSWPGLSPPGTGSLS